MLISSTGQNEGAVYNANGTNLTEAPVGPSNFTVGSFYYDFSGLTGAARMYTSEIVIVLADGTKQVPEDDQDQNDQQDGFDDDEVSVEEEDDQGLVRAHRTTLVRSINCTARMGFPTYTDALIYRTEFDDAEGATNAVLANSIGTLASWLDDQEVGVIEGALEGDTWWDFRAWLRWSFHWAIYKVKITEPASEAVSDDIAQSFIGPGGNAAGTLADNDAYVKTPMFGPAALLLALGADDIGDSENPNEWHEARWIRLWESKLPIPYIYRGNVDGLAYSIVPNYQASSIVPPWEGSDFDLLEADGDPSGAVEQSADVRALGRELRINIRRKCNIKVASDEMLVLHMQTGRARLQEPSVDNDVFDGGLVIAGQDLPARGPKFTLHHLRCFAR